MKVNKFLYYVPIKYMKFFYMKLGIHIQLIRNNVLGNKIWN